MNILKELLLFILTAVLLTSLVACEQENDPAPVAKRTVLVYMAADNSLSNLAGKDIEEMKEGLKKISSNDLRLLIYIDNGSSPRLMELKQQDDGTVKENIIREYNAPRNSCGQQEMTEVFRTAFARRFQAESYGLVYWSHADGWLPYNNPSTRWVGQDVSAGDYRMNLPNFVNVLAEAAPHLDFLLMDCCFMSSIEVAYELRKHTDYYLACPTQNPGPGAPYDRIVPLMAMIENPALAILQEYYASYEEIYDENRAVTIDHWSGGIAMTLTETAQLEPLAQLTNQLLTTHIADSYPNDLYRKIYNYDKRSGAYGYYDFAQAMQQILTDNEYATWRTAFDRTFTYLTTPKTYSNGLSNRLYSMKGTCGVTQYLFDADYSELKDFYQSLTWFTDAGWNNMGW